MISSLPKRPASANSTSDRPSKRMATSSPEEGELDDATPPPLRRSPSPPRNAVKLPGKVPFPFKKKPSAPENVANGASRERLGAYDREDERRQKEEDARRRFGLPPRPERVDDRDGRFWGTDRWAPGLERYDRPRWESQSYASEQRVYPREPDRRPHRSPSPSHHLDRQRPSRSRSRSTPTPRSPSSPRSPLTPSSIKEKHRLPPSRPVVPDPAAYRTVYDRDRWRDEDDRWPRKQDIAQDNYDYQEERTEPAEAYALNSPSITVPVSPPARLLSPRTTPEKSSISERANAPPPPPDDLPPPAPPNSAALQSKPPAPSDKGLMQPSLTTLPSFESDSRAATLLEQSKKEPATVRRPKRKPVHRTREQELEAYGRAFLGCGQQSDYTVMTKLGEGTFGEVHKAIHNERGHTVALKRILMHNEKEGMPVTALREIKILKALHHPCIVDILDMFVVRSHGKESPLSVYMVFPYMDHDLAGLLENERVKLSPSQIKLYMKQLLEGTEYMHQNHILHRDMKAANLLISNDGCLKIADFGLARVFDPTIVRTKEDARGKERKYTNCVVTRWYRPPELLLGARQYGGEVDMWGVGCVLGEMFFRKPILPGASDLDQLDKIWQLCGTPTAQSWPEYDLLPGCEGVKKFQPHYRRLRKTYESIGPETVDLLDKLLICNPRDRLTASQALDHEYFWTDPLPADPKSLPSYEASHEFDKRGRRHQAPAGPPVPHVEGHSRPFAMHPGMHGRPPPARESFRNGPPPGHYHPQPPMPGAPAVYGTHALPYLPSRQYHPMPLPPISLRPGQPPPQIIPMGINQSLPPPPHGYGRPPPSHLPARPPLSVPSGRSNGAGVGQRHGGYAAGGGELNYG